MHTLRNPFERRQDSQHSKVRRKYFAEAKQILLNLMWSTYITPNTNVQREKNSNQREKQFKTRLRVRTDPQVDCVNISVEHFSTLIESFERKYKILINTFMPRKCCPVILCQKYTSRRDIVF